MIHNKVTMKAYVWYDLTWITRYIGRYYLTYVTVVSFPTTFAITMIVGDSIIASTIVSARIALTIIFVVLKWNASQFCIGLCILIPRYTPFDFLNPGLKCMNVTFKNDQLTLKYIWSWRTNDLEYKCNN